MEFVPRMKLHILEVIYSKILNNSFKQAVCYIIKLLFKYDLNLSKYNAYFDEIYNVIYAFLQSFFEFKYSCNLGELSLNFMRINTKTLNPIDSSFESLTYILIKNFSDVIINTIIKKIDSIINNNAKKSSSIENPQNSLSLINLYKLFTFVIEIFYFFLYLSRKDFVYTNIFDHYFSFFTVNKGITQNDKIGGSSMNISFLFLFLKVGEYLYSHNSNSESDKYFIENPNNSKLFQKYSVSKVSKLCINCNKISLKSVFVCRVCCKKICSICFINYIKSNLDNYLIEKNLLCCVNISEIIKEQEGEIEIEEISKILNNKSETIDAISSKIQNKIKGFVFYD